jgi:hypothetical protein
MKARSQSWKEHEEFAYIQFVKSLLHAKTADSFLIFSICEQFRNELCSIKVENTLSTIMALSKEEDTRVTELRELGEVSGMCRKGLWLSSYDFGRDNPLYSIDNSRFYL